MNKILIALLDRWARWRRPWESSFDKNMTSLYAAVYRGAGTWPARESGECVACGHDFIPGEIVGLVAQAYERLPNGTVRRNPGTRLACCVCVERQRVEGDLSVAWAMAAGLL